MTFYVLSSSREKGDNVFNYIQQIYTRFHDHHEMYNEFLNNNITLKEEKKNNASKL